MNHMIDTNNIKITFYDELEIIDDFMNQSNPSQFIYVKTEYDKNITFRPNNEIFVPKMTDLFIKAKIIGGLFGFCNKISTPPDDYPENIDTSSDISLLKMSSAIISGNVDIFD